MFKKTQLTAIGAAMLISALAFASCAADGETETVSAVEAVVEKPIETKTEAFVEAMIEQAIPEVEIECEPVQLVTKIADMVIDGAKLFAVCEGAVITYDFSDKSYSVVGVDDKLRAVAIHDDAVYVGGQNLYKFNGAAVEKVDVQIGSDITNLYSYNDRLMVGSAQGLYSADGVTSELLLDDVVVSTMVADANGLWVGTMGQGLFRWDGEDFKKRYLLRDPTMFNTVNALDYNHDHLYVGADRGLHIYNGGRWEILTTAEGLPANNVRTIDASAWVVYAGTEEGVVSWFGGDLRPVKKLANKRVNSLKLRGNRVIAATDFEGILAQSNSRLKTLVPSVLDTTMDILSLIP
jgi:ligand-binding sensor domain-containing protein